jgi:hypothetical protein
MLNIFDIMLQFLCKILHYFVQNVQSCISEYYAIPKNFSKRDEQNKKMKTKRRGHWTHTCQAARCVFGLLVGLPTCGAPVARKKTGEPHFPPLSHAATPLSLSLSAFFPSGDDRGVAPPLPVLRRALRRPTRV